MRIPLDVVWIGVWAEIVAFFGLQALSVEKIWSESTKKYENTQPKMIFMDLLEPFFSGSWNDNICAAFHTVNWLLSVPIMIVKPLLEMSRENLCFL